jgi:pimeloyl-ACP methyl ester carboxylesterase
MARSWYMLLFALPGLPEALFGARDGALWARALRQTSRPGTLDEEALAPYRRSWARPGALRAMFHWHRGLIGQAAPRASRGAAPTLLLWGVRDVALGRELAAPSLAWCDDGRLELVPTATHWIQHEEPALVNARLLRHLLPAAASASSR